MIKETLLEEAIKREQKYYRLNTEYKITSAQTQNFVNSLKPNQVIISNDNQPEDEEFKEMLARMNKVPREKYPEPQTSSQEYGWFTQPLVAPILDPRFHHPKMGTEITRLYATEKSTKSDQPAGAKK